MRIRQKYISFLAVALLLSGCGEKSGEALSGSGGEVVATVGAHQLTEGELGARANNIVALYRHKMGEKVNTNYLAKVEAIFREGYAKVWAEDRVLEDYAAAEGVRLDPAVVTNLQRGAFQNFRTKGDKNYAAMLSAAGVNETYWNDQVASTARRVAVRGRWAAAEPLSNPEEAVAAEFEKMRLWNARSALTNAVQWAKATNVWNQVKAGGDFVAIGKANTENPEEIEDDCEWAVVDEKFLEDEPVLKKRLKTMKVGDVSEPLEVDNGICIVRLDAMEQDEGYRLSRVFIRLATIVSPAPAQEIRAELEKQHAERLFARKLAELVQAASEK